MLAAIHRRHSLRTTFTRAVTVLLLPACLILSVPRCCEDHRASCLVVTRLAARLVSTLVKLRSVPMMPTWTSILVSVVTLYLRAQPTFRSTTALRCASPATPQASADSRKTWRQIAVKSNTARWLYAGLPPTRATDCPSTRLSTTKTGSSLAPCIAQLIAAISGTHLTAISLTTPH